MINQEISRIFSNIADYLEMDAETTTEGSSQRGNSFFRIRAFRKASEVVEKYPKDLAKLTEYDLVKIPGIGKSTAKDIVEYSKSGKIEYYEQLKEQSPVKLEELTNIQGMGPKRVKKLYFALGITNLEQLKKAAQDGKIAEIEGFGKKSQESILENINFAIVNKDRNLLNVALETATEYIKYLKQNDNGVTNISYAGSLRRFEETIGDVDILVSSKNPEKTHSVFTKYNNVEKILGSGSTKSSVWLKSKVQVDLRVVPVESFGSALQYFTGSVDHNVSLRKIAISKGYKLSEYGVFTNSGDNLTKNKTEEEVYKLLVNNYIIPELRVDSNEIELALNNKLPNVIDLKSIKGDIQMHTTHSDGKNTPDEMVEKCISLGYRYMGITDHFGNLGVANAVKENEFEKYLEDLKRVKEKYKSKITVFIGCEANIKPNGDLDFKQELLEKLDYVLAGVHSSIKQDASKATERYLNCLDNPVVTAVVHPTGRLLGQRPGFEFNYEEVFSKAANTNTAVEINSHPMRLDLPYQLVKIALEQSCKITINTDAHSVQELELMKYGVYTARKAGLEAKDLFVLNTP